MQVRKWMPGLLAALLWFPATTDAWATDDLEAAKQQVEVLQDQKSQIDQQMQTTLAEIHQLEAEIQSAMQKSTELNQAITVTTAKLEIQQEKLKGRVKTMYEGGDVTFWSVLFDATDFSDFLDRLSMLTMIVEKDKEIVDEYKATQAVLKQQQADLEGQQKLRQAKQAKLQAIEADLQAKYQAISQQLAVSHEEIAEIEAAGVAAYASYAAGVQAGQIIPQTGGGSFAWPVPSAHTISSGYGPRPGEFHKGIDITAPVGTPIVAAGDGTVWQAGSASGFGHWIVILHDNGVMSVYGHMFGSGVYVSAGQRVTRGEVIGAIGNDGQSSGPHLHFAIATGTSGGRLNYINPMGYLQ